MFSTTDTIVAIATPPGRGGIGVVRVSGADAARIARVLTTHDGDLEPRRATFTKIRGSRGDRVIDHALVTFFPAPHSYTSEDVVEISAHGSPAVLREIVASAVTHGARVAEPGEFTLRAFLNGRLDLMQAEAVADLVDAVTPLQARVAFDQLEGTLTTKIAAIDARLFDLVAGLEASVDFPDDGYQFVAPDRVREELERIEADLAALGADAHVGRLVREGAQVSIVGRPNVGKSSVFNALVGVARAIVTEVPGTTRDLVTEAVDLDGLEVTLVDTAGLRATEDRVEAIGVDLARRAQTVSDLILFVVDASQPDADILPDLPSDRLILVANKADLAPVPGPGVGTGAGCLYGGQAPVRVSALTGDGIGDLRAAIVRALDRDNLRERPAITNVRHASLVERARVAVGRAAAALGAGEAPLPEEFVLADLQEARGALEEIVGRRAPDDLLAHIFARFCIGK